MASRACSASTRADGIASNVARLSAKCIEVNMKKRYDESTKDTDIADVGDATVGKGEGRSAAKPRSKLDPYDGRRWTT
jgi:hypothetical protein